MELINEKEIRALIRNEIESLLLMAFRKSPVTVYLEQLSYS